MTKRSRIHHYVPQHLISNFSGNDKGQVCVFDKHEDRKFWTNPKNICAENGFNEFAMEQWVVSFEDAVTHLENLYHPVIQEIIRKESLADLSIEDDAKIRMFLALQFLRTKFLRNQFDHIGELLKDEFAKHGVDIADVEGFDDPSEDEVKANYLTGLFERVRDFGAMLSDRDLVLMRASDEAKFWLGDHPVVLHNNLDHGPYGNIGWAIQGIQIYVPISPELMLGCFCPSIGREQVQQARALKMAVLQHTAAGVSLPDALKIVDMSAERYREIIAGSEDIIRAAKGELVIALNSENVEHVNALQVRYSCRYLISASEDFELVERMIADNEEYRTEARPKVR